MINFIDSGYLGKQAESRTIQSGERVTNFSLAVSSGYGDKQKTLWLDCSAWGDRFTKLAEFLPKGAHVHVAGELGTREHEGKTYLTLRVAEVKLLGKKGDTHKPAESKPAQTDGFEDEIVPF